MEKRKTKRARIESLKSKHAIVPAERDRNRERRNPASKVVLGKGRAALFESKKEEGRLPPNPREGKEKEVFVLQRLPAGMKSKERDLALHPYERERGEEAGGSTSAPSHPEKRRCFFFVGGGLGFLGGGGFLGGVFLGGVFGGGVFFWSGGGGRENAAPHHTSFFHAARGTQKNLLRRRRRKTYLLPKKGGGPRLPRLEGTITRRRKKEKRKYSGRRIASERRGKRLLTADVTKQKGELVRGRRHSAD